MFNIHTGVRLEPTTGSSAMTLRSSSPVSLWPVWWRVVLTSSACVLSTAAAWVIRPECPNQWPPWTRLTAPAWEVQLNSMCDRRLPLYRVFHFYMIMMTMYLLTGTSAPWTGQIIVTEEEPAGRRWTCSPWNPATWLLCYLILYIFWPTEGIVPGRPLELQVTEATKNYVVLSWKPPGEKGLEGVRYYVEKVNYVLTVKSELNSLNYSFLLFGSVCVTMTADGWILVSLFVSVCRAQTAGRGWTRRSQSSPLALRCSIWPRGSPTASVSGAATLPGSVNPPTRPRSPQLATSLVRKRTYTINNVFLSLNKQKSNEKTNFAGKCTFNQWSMSQPLTRRRWGLVSFLV